MNVAEKSVFRKEEAQKILKAMVDGMVKVAEPLFDFEGGVRYPKLEEATGLSAETLNSALEELKSAGCLTSETVSALALCPKCGSYKFALQISCPMCGSPKLERAVMIEHLTCGYVGGEKDFTVGGSLTCPRCRKTLKAIGVDYRRLGNLYRCLGCNATFPQPKRTYICSDGHAFEEDEALIREIGIYRLNPAKRALIERETLDFSLLLREIAEGWHCQSPAVIRGKSGVEHRFAFAIWADGSDPSRDAPEVLAEVIVSDAKVDSDRTLASLAKILDVKPREGLLMVMPKLDNKGRMLANSYDVHVVEAEEASELMEKAGGALEEALKRRQKDALRMEAEALRDVLRELGVIYEGGKVEAQLQETVKKSFAELDHLLFEGKIGLDEYIRRRKRILNSVAK